MKRSRDYYFWTPLGVKRTTLESEKQDSIPSFASYRLQAAGKCVNISTPVSQPGTVMIPAWQGCCED